MKKYKIKDNITGRFTIIRIENLNDLETAKSDFACQIIEDEMILEEKGSYGYLNGQKLAFLANEAYRLEEQLRQDKVYERLVTEEIK